MKRLIFSLVTVGLLSTSIHAKTIMADMMEISCPDQYTLGYLLGEYKAYKTDPSIKKLFDGLGCKYIGEGVELKILKTKKLDLGNDSAYKKALLVRLPNGSTTYIAR